MRDRNLYAICHGDGLTGNILHIIHIDEIGSVAADKLFVIFQLFAQIIRYCPVLLRPYGGTKVSVPSPHNIAVYQDPVW